jgi:hypothetical protein
MFEAGLHFARLDRCEFVVAQILDPRRAAIARPRPLVFAVQHDIARWAVLGGDDRLAHRAIARLAGMVLKLTCHQRDVGHGKPSFPGRNLQDHLAAAAISYRLGQYP